MADLVRPARIAAPREYGHGGQDETLAAMECFKSLPIVRLEKRVGRE